ncbi:MAG: DUF456 domain-containing protein [Pirellulales bacterium]
MGWTTVFVLLALAVAGELLEFAASAATAARQGGSRRGMALALLGALFGSVLGVGLGSPIPVLGQLIGAVAGGAVGAFAGAYVGESWKGRPEDEPRRRWQGGLLGRGSGGPPASSRSAA